jgi:hypothetical protein
MTPQVKKKFEQLDPNEVNALMKDCSDAIKYQITRHIFGTPRFALLVFNDPKHAHYASSCDRTATIAALRDCADQLEKLEAGGK